MRAALQLDVSTPAEAWAPCAELAPFDLTGIERAVVVPVMRCSTWTQISLA
ncbi:MAG: hypothetical protein ABJE66_14165 [Deltaproteobacteria bacterium]